MNEGVTSRGEANAISSENGPTMGITRSVMTTLDERCAHHSESGPAIRQRNQLRERINNVARIFESNGACALKSSQPEIGRLFFGTIPKRRRLNHQCTPIDTNTVGAEICVHLRYSLRCSQVRRKPAGFFQHLPRVIWLGSRWTRGRATSS